jgi:hypothetical protein
MSLNQATRMRSGQSPSHRIYDAVVAYGWHAPHMIALKESHAQFLTDVKISQQLSALAPPATRSQFAASVRSRLGEFLVRIGTTLQGNREDACPSAAGPVAASSGSRP